MKIVDLSLTSLREAHWNPNVMDEAMLGRLRESVLRFGLVQNLVVRPLTDEEYEVLSGNQRLRVLKELGIDHAACVVVDLDDAHARLLAQALNHIEGEDDLGLRAELVRDILKEIPEKEVLSILPETAQGLEGLSSLGQETVAEYLENWQQAQSARLKHMQFQLTSNQLEVVEEALAQVLPEAKQRQGESPNARGTALFLLCEFYLQKGGGDESRTESGS